MKYFTLLVALCATLFSIQSIAQPTASATAPTRPAADVISIFSGAYTDLVGTNFNPNWGQGNQVTDFTIPSTSDVTKKYQNLDYQGTQFAASQNVANYSALHLDVWTDVVTSFKIFPINPGSPELGIIKTTVVGWNSIEIPIADFVALGLPMTNVTQFKIQDDPFLGQGTGTKTLYFDNIYFWKPANVPTITGFSVPAKLTTDAPFTLTAPTSNSSGAFTYMSGNTGVATISGNTVTIVGAGTSLITANQAADGSYVAGSTTASLVVSSVGPPTAAPTPPARAAADVISVFSNAYTDLTGTDFFPNWGQSTVVTEVMIAGNATKKYTNFNYEGTQFATPINASTMNTLHIDYWSATVNSFDVFLVNIGGAEQKVTLTPTLSGWNALDIPLSSYTAINLNNVGQFKLEGRPSGGTVYLDNLYFYNAPVVVPTEPTTAAATPTRAAANVISVFSNAYTDLTGTDFFPNWGQATVVTEVMIAGNATKKYTSFNYEGTQFAMPINALTMETLHIDYWSATVNSFDIFLVNIGGAEQKVTVTPTLSGWNALDIPLSSYTAINLSNVGQFKLEGRPSGGTVYLDNIYFYKAPPTTPTVAATAPTLPANQVISMFSNTYTNRPIDTWRTGWSSGGLEDIQVGGNDIKKYTGLGFIGVEFTGGNMINTVNATHMHLDVWSPNAIAAGGFKVKLVDFGANGTHSFSPTAGDDTEGEVLNLPAIPAATWVALDIPFTDFAAVGLTNKSRLAQFIPSGPGGATVFMDNIYFYASTVLTVELTTVKAKAVNTTTVLTWETASEKDNAGFTIERSTDATTYTAIGNVKGNGTTNTASNYTFTDATPLNGVNYYRLRQADFNGKESLSKVVSVVFGKNTLALKNTLVQNTLEVIVSESEKTPLSIFNVSGQLVFSAKVQGTQVLDVSSLTAGMYIVRMGTGEARRFVKN